jgi:YD repeat-containing protein
MTFTDQTPLGRKTTSTIDAQGRTVGQQFANLNAAIYHHDVRGRLDNATLGTGVTARSFTFAYNPKVDPPVEGHLAGFLDTVKDPMLGAVSFRYDLAGRIKTQTLSDSREIGFTYDANGNVATITPPGRPAHIFHYTKVDLLRDYTPPDVGNGAKPIVYHYDEDQRLDQITRADGSSMIVLGYEPGKSRLQTITTPATITAPAGTLKYDYNASTGNLKSIIAPNATVSYTFDGVLLKDTVWTGAVLNNAVNPACCSVNRRYNNRFLLEDERVNNTAEFFVRFDYDNDNLLTKAGALTILVNTTALAKLTITVRHSGTHRSSRFNTPIATNWAVLLKRWKPSAAKPLPTSTDTIQSGG